MDDDDGASSAAKEWGFDESAIDSNSWCFHGGDNEEEDDEEEEDVRCRDIREMYKSRAAPHASDSGAPPPKRAKKAPPSELRGVSAVAGAHSPLLRPPNRVVSDVPLPLPPTRGRRLVDWLSATPGSRVVFVEDMPAGVPVRICVLRHEHGWIPEQLDYLLQFSGERVLCMDACGRPNRAFCCLWRNYLDNLTTVDPDTMLPSVDFDEEDTGPAVHVYLRH
jgi:hypothetical protein